MPCHARAASSAPFLVLTCDRLRTGQSAQRTAAHDHLHFPRCPLSCLQAAAGSHATPQARPVPPQLNLRFWLQPLHLRGAAGTPLAWVDVTPTLEVRLAAPEHPPITIMSKAGGGAVAGGSSAGGGGGAAGGQEAAGAAAAAAAGPLRIAGLAPLRELLRSLKDTVGGMGVVLEEMEGSTCMAYGRWGLLSGRCTRWTNGCG